MEGNQSQEKYHSTQGHIIYQPTALRVKVCAIRIN